VLFDTAEIPWWAWVRRFHLPEVSAKRAVAAAVAWLSRLATRSVSLQAEKLNGRAAMMGYVLALFVDQLTGEGHAPWAGTIPSGLDAYLERRFGGNYFAIV
jgi:hypothetical protein